MEDLSNLSLDDRKLVVGIDFGTTFSGVAWAETRRSDFQSVIETWPVSLNSQDRTSSPKVPTELRYTPQGLEWGFQIPPLVDRHHWFKLGLSSASSQQQNPEQLTTDYLKKLYEHAMATLTHKLGATVIRYIPIQFCLTVPAIWSEVAKEKTLKACQEAGIKSNSEILLVSEPEAAAMFALHGLDPHGMKVGETFVLCDAGGGTVDLISYTITSLSPILKVKEAAPGSGGLCGSTFLNRKFGEFLVEKLGEEPGWDNEILEEAMERFDLVIKKQFSGMTDDNEGYSIPVAGLANNQQLGIRRGRFNMKREEVKGIFDPIVNKIIELVQNQVKATKSSVKAVLLVGGFGQNNYLKEQLHNAVGKQVEILQPPNAWTAVVRGAVMMGIARSNPNLTAIGVESRAARKHYGMLLGYTFDETIHDKAKRFWDKRYDEYRIYVFEWFIKRGDPVEEGKPVRINFTSKRFIVGEKLGNYYVNVYCDEESQTAPLHESAATRRLVKLKADLSQLSASEVANIPTATTADGKLRYRIKASVEATFYSASTRYVLNYNGKQYDSVTAEYV